ncbi:MAG: NFACT family protein, partial [Acidobacteria bacterium]|nr:NFACT family protein [Acidobacteriota bacterium]
MDNFLLQAIVNELEPLLANHRLGRTVQLNTTDVALDFRLRDGRWLVASTDPSRLALYLTTRQPKQLSEEPRTDTAFVALIKKYLSGARLTGMEKLGYDRVVTFHFEAENEDGTLSTRKLVVSLTGRGANLLLVESNRVLARLRESGEAEETYSEPPPPAEKLDPFQCSAAQLYSLMAESDGNLATAAHKRFIGFTETYARELAFRASQTDAEQALRQLLADLFEANPVPTLYSSPSLEELKREIGRDEFHLTLSPIELRHLATLPQTSFSTVNEAAEICFSLLDARRRFLAQKQKLTSQLAAKLKKQR